MRKKIYLTLLSVIILFSGFYWEIPTSFATTILPVPYDRQDRRLSCEAASLKMILAYRGIAATEDDIMTFIGYDPTPKSGKIWGDPDIGFVGNINGAQNTTGYGVHPTPVGRAANIWRPSIVFSGLSVQQLAQSIVDGNPVIIWGTYGRALYQPWFTPEGKKVHAWKGEHTRVVVGFTGTVENPKSFIMLDPLFGKMTWSTTKLRNDWKKFGYSGVVVY